MNILIIGIQSDPQVMHVKHHFDPYYHLCDVVDMQQLGTSIFLEYNPNQDSGELLIRERRIRLDEIDAIYWHQLKMPQSFDEYQKQESLSLLSCLFRQTSIFWVNSLSSLQYHKAKPKQLRQAAMLGARVPQTLVSNQLKSKSEYQNVAEELVIKPVHGGRHTLVFNDDKLPVDPPFTLQQKIPGTNVRTYVIGHQVYSGEIHSQHIDYRKDQVATAVSTELPANMTTLAIRICRAFGMQWCAIDWRKTPQGNYYFLEANPCPYFLKFEAETGWPITQSLVALLLSPRA